MSAQQGKAAASHQSMHQGADFVRLGGGSLQAEVGLSISAIRLSCHARCQGRLLGSPSSRKEGSTAKTIPTSPPVGLFISRHVGVGLEYKTRVV